MAKRKTEAEKNEALFSIVYWVVLILCICALISYLVLIRVRAANTPWPEAERSAYSTEQSNKETAVVSFMDNPAAIQSASKSVVMLSGYNEAGELLHVGSAFAAFEDGLFVTCWHVVEGAAEYRAKTESQEEFTLDEVVAYDAERDLAILRSSADDGKEPLPLGNSADLIKGAKVLAIGSPLGITNTVSSGLYSGWWIENEGQEYIRFTIATSEGNSGGPVFNEAGEVVGVNSRKFDQGQNLSLATPIEDVIDLYDSI